MAGNTIGQAVITIGADASGFEKSLTAETKAGSKTAAEKSGNVFTDTLGGALKTGALVVGGAVTGILGTALVKGFERLTAIDDAKAKLTGLKMPAEKVTEVMNNALASVKGTAFGLGEAATLAASAVAAGIKPGADLTRTLKLMADAASISGRPLNEMGAIFNKVAASGKVTGDILNQLSDSGIPIIGLLATQLHTTSGDVVDLVTKGKVGFADFQAAMEKGLGGAALKSGDTFSGSMKNALAALGRLGEGLLSGVFAQIPGLMKGAIDWIDKVTPTAKAVGAAIGSAFTAAYDAITSFVGKVIEFAQSPEVSAFMAGVTENVGLVKQYVTDFVNDPTVQEFVKTMWDKAVAAIQGLASWIQEDLIPALITLGGWVRDGVNFFRDHEAAARALGVTIGIVAGLVVAAWVAQGVVATWNAALIVVAWLATATAATTSETIQSKSTAQIVVGWLAAAAGAVWAGALIVGSWIAQAAAATANAVIIAAAWLLAFWPIALIVAAVIGLAVIVWKNLDTIKSFISGAWDWITEITYNTWQNIYDWLEGAWNSITDNVSSWIENVKGWINTGWEWIKMVTAAAWDVIKWFIFGPIGAIVIFVSSNLETIKGFISGAWEWIKSATSNAWNVVTSFISTAWDNIKRAVSERIDAVVGFARDLPGKIVGAVGDLARLLWDKGTAAIQGLWDGALDKLKGIGDWASSIKDKIVDAIKGVFGIHSPSTVFAGLGQNMMQGLLNGLLQSPSLLLSAVKSIGGTVMDWLGGLGSRVGEFFSSMFTGGAAGAAGGAARWAGVAQQAMAMAGLDASYLPLLLHRMNVESGGNPNAINLWDSNAKAGHPSMGLMQTIPGTFAAYAGPLVGRGINDPLANIYAAIKYTLARYGLGGIQRAWGGAGGYASGTPSAVPGWALVGEQGPEWMRFRGGERVLPNGQTPGSTINVTMTVSVDDLDKMSKVGDFIDMLDRARLNGRRTARSGMVSA